MVFALMLQVKKIKHVLTRRAKQTLFHVTCTAMQYKCVLNMTLPHYQEHDVGL